MPNWININTENNKVFNGDVLVNLDSGVVVSREDDEGGVKVWSLHGGDRYLLAENTIYDKVVDNIKGIDYYSRVNEIDWSPRVANCFRNCGIIYMGDLLNKTEHDLLMLRSFWKKSLSEVVYKLREHNLRLKSD
jgi:hypothetical protein|tara:strand:+ start:80 stop:481 length:402 start_codon:yes stop_codon:yes gene_type:complete